ncbi:MAG: hypothetical protein H0U45_16200 [Tatlockia sp.]|nr:hypothetical protein [Tatlockia sp.]
MQIQDFDYSIKKIAVLSSLSMSCSRHIEQGFQDFIIDNAIALHADLEVA